MHIVTLAGIAPQPWRNGGGTTRDLLALPSPADWWLRISVAEVARSGPFSAYPGIERWFAVAEGAGVVLGFDDGEQRLLADSAPIQFDGAAAPACTLIAGVTQDLNLLVRQDAGHSLMQAVADGGPWRSDAALRAVFVWQAATLHVEGRPPLMLPAQTLAWTDAANGEPWTLHPAAPSLRAWWLAFEAHTR
ncbi:HutD family protein [Rubrivivax sp. A210]|uniref:HutD/Ves family protein n=1 Tax=Rubrivivax sp. A210 TaxID=2772301 RepID=UPI00191B393F|nr:HutD family protein [Rubrivivax sp. A210]CAD5372006.1 HutD family protein [Rubrivivax sp. A210]